MQDERTLEQIQDKIIVTAALWLQKFFTVQGVQTYQDLERLQEQCFELDGERFNLLEVVRKPKGYSKRSVGFLIDIYALVPDSTGISFQPQYDKTDPRFRKGQLGLKVSRGLGYTEINVNRQQEIPGYKPLSPVLPASPRFHQKIVPGIEIIAIQEELQGLAKLVGF